VKYLVEGMHGLGDNLHQRPTIRYVLAQGCELWLKTPWPCLYHDMAGPRLHFVDIRSRLRKQAQNAIREATQFETPPSGLPCVQFTHDLPTGWDQRWLRYPAAIAGTCGVPLDIDFNFSLPVLAAWDAKLAPWLDRWCPDKPIMAVRPLVERAEWLERGRARNPDAAAYGMLFAALREKFFVVSVADLADGKEWQVGQVLDADVYLHRGELDVEALLALFATAALVFTAPGFALPMAQAVRTPVICVFGGYEDASCYVTSPEFLAIEPIKPCRCFQQNHACNKTIDMLAAFRRLYQFLTLAHLMKE
jgi:hypothetical protein